MSADTGWCQKFEASGDAYEDGFRVNYRMLPKSDEDLGRRPELPLFRDTNIKTYCVSSRPLLYGVSVAKRLSNLQRSPGSHAPKFKVSHHVDITSIYPILDL
jgi:hypothetical protein